MLFNLEIKKKSGSSINPDIHHSKVPNSEQIRGQLKTENITILNLPYFTNRRKKETCPTDLLC